jgi:anhydro-N-acetylmuramic acid kinase
MTLYLGLMSGTSMDGIDAALLEVESGRLRLQRAARHPWPVPLQQRLRHAADSPEQVHLSEYGALDTAVGIEFALAAQALLAVAALAPGAIRAIGCHGQTLLHRPRGPAPFTLQIGDPNLIAERTGIDVVADFRRRDLAAGGEGAPLMPAFHAAAFAAPGETRAVLNLGGIANLSVLGADGSVTGFDTGPGNCLLDAWARRHLGQPFDAGGAWAATGHVDEALLSTMLADPFFARTGPKSTGRETFSDAWLDDALAARPLPPADVQATLCELTAASVAQALGRVAGPAPQGVYLCGGGILNANLLARLAMALPGRRLASTAECGIDPEHVEAAGFAWLACRYVSGLPGNLPAVTGARHPAPLGALYRGK